MNEHSSNLAAALALLQTKLPEIKKTEFAKVETQKGSYSYTYANLAGISAQIMPLLGDLGLSFIAKPTFSGERFVLAYSLLHTSGEREDGEYPLPTTGTPQAIGSAITYGRRYCLCAVTGVAPEDDDDGAAAEAMAQTEQGTAQRRTRPSGGQSTQRQRPTAQRAAGQAPALPGEEHGDGVTRDQMGRVMKLFNQIGGRYTDRSERLAASTAIVGRPIASATELTKVEASQLIYRLDKVAAAGEQAEARLAEMVEERQGVDDGDPLAYVADDAQPDGAP
jgi:hypothetical protein